MSYRPLTDIKPGVWELREQDEEGWYRLVYLTPIHGVIYVLHCFQKKSRAMSKPNREMILKRYSDLHQELVEKRAEKRR